MIARRLLLLLAVLMGLTALAVALAPPPETAPVRPVPPPADPAQSGGAPSGDAEVIERTMTAEEPGATVRVPQGETLRLTVRGAQLDSVEIVGLDRLAAVTPEAPTVLDLLADQPGSYPVVLVEAGVELGRIEVTPRR